MQALQKGFYRKPERMDSAARNARTSLTFINQEKRQRRAKKIIRNLNANATADTIRKSGFWITLSWLLIVHVEITKKIYLCG